jgi:hypothetical protein
MGKVLWIVGMGAADQARLLAHAQTVGADTVCIRSDNDATLPGAIAAFHAANIAVWAWRWPAVELGPHQAPHYYAMDEADNLIKVLMPAGLDGYVIDPEADAKVTVNNWNNQGPLAQSFCQAVTAAIAAGVPTCAAPFRFGVTAGCTQPTGDPNIPWAVFAGACDTVYPQAYWRAVINNVPTKVHGGTPDSSHAKAVAAWGPVSHGLPMCCMAGELSCVTAAEIAAYGALTAGQPDRHFYTDAAGLDPAVLAAIAAL